MVAREQEGPETPKSPEGPRRTRPRSPRAPRPAPARASPSPARGCAPRGAGTSRRCQETGGGPGRLHDAGGGLPRAGPVLPPRPSAPGPAGEERHGKEAQREAASAPARGRLPLRAPGRWGHTAAGAAGAERRIHFSGFWQGARRESARHCATGRRSRGGVGAGLRAFPRPRPAPAPGRAQISQPRGGWAASTRRGGSGILSADFA